MGYETIRQEQTQGVTQSSVASAASDTLLLAPNPYRLPGSTITNDSTSILYISLGTTPASVTNYWKQVAASAAFAQIPDNFTGMVRGIWATANGAARVTEIHE
jgi:hypothetical protein